MTRIDEIKERVAKASPGPWENPSTTNVVNIPSDIDPCEIQAHGPPEWDYEADLQFIENAREDIPWLLARLEAAEKVVEAAKMCCDIRNYTSLGQENRTIKICGHVFDFMKNSVENWDALKENADG